MLRIQLFVPLALWAIWTCCPIETFAQSCEIIDGDFESWSVDTFSIVDTAGDTVDYFYHSPAPGLLTQIAQSISNDHWVSTADFWYLGLFDYPFSSIDSSGDSHSGSRSIQLEADSAAYHEVQDLRGQFT